MQRTANIKLCVYATVLPFLKRASQLPRYHHPQKPCSYPTDFQCHRLLFIALNGGSGSDVTDPTQWNHWLNKHFHTGEIWLGKHYAGLSRFFHLSSQPRGRGCYCVRRDTKKLSRFPQEETLGMSICWGKDFLLPTLQSPVWFPQRSNWQVIAAMFLFFHQIIHQAANSSLLIATLW